jgi:hypothetical protein
MRHAAAAKTAMEAHEASRDVHELIRAFSGHLVAPEDACQFAAMHANLQHFPVLLTKPVTLIPITMTVIDDHLVTEGR